MGMILAFPFDEQPGSLAEADTEGGRKRAGADTPLLASAVKQGVDGDAVANPQCADALGPVNLGAGEGDPATGDERDGATPQGPHGRAEQERTRAAGHRRAPRRGSAWQAGEH